MRPATTPTVTTTEEALLLGRVAAGDHGGPLVELYDRYASRLYGLGLRLMGDAGMAEELVQETFLRLWRSASRYDPERGSVPHLPLHDRSAGGCRPAAPIGLAATADRGGARGRARRRRPSTRSCSVSTCAMH